MNMSYCRHENTAHDLEAVVTDWNGDEDEDGPTSFNEHETEGRRSIMEAAARMFLAMQEAGVVNGYGEVAEGAESVFLDMDGV